MYSSFDDKYAALAVRDPNAEGHFVYGVLTTNVCCRPTCSARLALAKNVVFYETVEQAQTHGFEPCKRCKPQMKAGWNNTRERIALACAQMGHQAARGELAPVAKVAARVGMSKWHFCRAFKNYTGQTPRQFQLQCKAAGKRLHVVLPAVVTKRYMQKMREPLAEGGVDQSVGLSLGPGLSDVLAMWCEMLESGTDLKIGDLEVVVPGLDLGASGGSESGILTTDGLVSEGLAGPGVWLEPELDLAEWAKFFEELGGQALSRTCVD